jgi:hypothetical protein
MSQAPSNCNCATRTSLNPNIFPTQACDLAATIGSCPVTIEDKLNYLQKSTFASSNLLKNQLALGAFQVLPTGWFLCQHNSVPMNSAEALCDGSSNSDYCQCI